MISTLVLGESRRARPAPVRARTPPAPQVAQHQVEGHRFDASSHPLSARDLASDSASPVLLDEAEPEVEEAGDAGVDDPVPDVVAVPPGGEDSLVDETLELV